MLPESLRAMAGLGVARLRAGLADLAVVGLIGLSLLTSAGFALSAAHHLLRRVAGPAGASAIMALCLLVVALGLALLLSSRRPRKPDLSAPAPAPAPTIPAPPPAPPAPPADLGAQAAFLAGFLLARRW